MRDDVARQLGRVIASAAPEIERRWLDQVQRDIARDSEVELTQLRDGIPDYLDALQQMLTRSGANHVGDRGAAVWSAVAREHGITRVRIGFDIDQLIHEFIALRVVITKVAAERGLPDEHSKSVLADLIDAAILEAVRAYVDARNFEARRIQAENIGFLIHELRNPLSTAIQAMAVLRDATSTDRERALEVIERSHRRLNQMIDGVLYSERLMARSVEPRMREVLEQQLLEDAVEAARSVATAKGLAFELTCSPERVVRIDPELTRSAIQNLVDNAVKYTDQGGVQVVVEATAADWSVHVRDTCHGLSPEELRTIFEPFRRGSSPKAGTGLGLAIARQAIEAQGGTIQAESTGSCGCHFWITIPK